MKRFLCLHDRVLVRPDAAPQRSGGLAVAPSQEDEVTTGVVVEMGPMAARSLNIMDVRVQWRKYAGRELIVAGEKMRLLMADEIDGVWEGE